MTTLLFVGCKPTEPMLELQLERQMIGEPFSFADYCEEEYNSIFLVYPYFNTEKEGFVTENVKFMIAANCIIDDLYVYKC